MGTPARAAAGTGSTTRGGDRPEEEGVFDNTTGVVAGGVALTATQFQALLQAVQSNTPPQPNPPPAQAVAQAQGPSFALTPGQANANRFIDYTLLTGIELWQEAMASLPNKFSVEGQDTNQFCESLLERVDKLGWNSPQSDIMNVNVEGQAINIFSGYGQVTAQDIITHSTYLGNQDQRAQNDAQLYHCIKNSLTPEAERKILAE